MAVAKTDERHGAELSGLQEKNEDGQNNFGGKTPWLLQIIVVYV